MEKRIQPTAKNDLGVDIDYKAQYERLSQKAEIVISQLRADRDRLLGGNHGNDSK